jgi:hypothetical protein
MIKTICCVAFASSLFAISNASAGQPRTHDGFFMRLSGGVSYASTTVESDNKNEVKFEDFGGHGNFAIGGMIAHNLALHGTVWGWDIADGDVAINGQEDNTNLDINLGAVGGGLTYYFEPSNIYVSGSLGIGKINFSTIFEDTDMGVAFEALLGKEWWVGDSWDSVWPATSTTTACRPTSSACLRTRSPITGTASGLASFSRRQ